MARTPRPTEAEIDRYAHDAAKRANIPPAELQALVPDDDKAAKTRRYPRNTDLDPQLVWRGKDAEDAAPLSVPAPPVYVQEKIEPRAFIDDLRRRTRERRGEAPGAQHDFYAAFNGIDPEARTEFYAHRQNWQNRMILGDSLMVMASQIVVESLLRAGVQNTKKGEAIAFDWLRPRVSRSGWCLTRAATPRAARPGASPSASARNTTRWATSWCAAPRARPPTCTIR